MNKNVKRTLLAVMVSSMLAASFATLSVSADDTATGLIFSENGEMASLGETNTDPISEAVWKIGDTGYATLAEAVKAAPIDGTLTTIVLQKSTQAPGVKVLTGQNIVFDFNGFTYTVTDTVGSSGTETNGFQLLKGATVTMKNGTVKSGSSAQILIQKYCNLTLENVNLDASENSNCGYVVSNNCGSTLITGNTNITAAAGKVAFDLYYWPSNGYTDGVSVTVDETMTGTIVGNIEYGSDGKDKENCAEKAILNIEGGTFEGTFSTYGLDTDNATGINVSGGSYNTSVPDEYLADSVEATVKSDSGRMVVYTDIQDAVNAASAGDTVSVKQDKLSATVDPNKGIKFDTTGVTVAPTLTTPSGEKVEIGTDGSTVQTTFTATVNNVSTSYTKGQTVTISTPEYYNGHVFKNWVVSSGNVTLANPYSATTTFVMPAENVTVYAVYDEVTFVPVLPEQPTVTAPARDGWVKIGARWYLYDNGEKLTGWQKDGNTWYYLDEKGIMLCGGLTEIDGQTYYFYDWGGMASSWWYEDEDGNWFYFRGNGAMATSSWIEWKGEYYYVGADGKMLTNTTTPDGYRVDANGVWVR